jgi:hypothetical protein
MFKGDLEREDQKSRHLAVARVGQLPLSTLYEDLFDELRSRTATSCSVSTMQ